MFIENETYKCDCIDLDSEGNGVCKIEDFIFFVKGPLKGERVSIKVDKLNKNYGLATLNQIYSKSPYRVKPICDYYDKCGGCNLMHFNYFMHANYKKHTVRELISRIAKVDCLVNDTISMEDPRYYRNNIQLFFSMANGIVQLGFYGKRSKTVIDIDKCITSPKITDRLIPFIKKVIEQNNISIYNPKTKKGCLKSLMIRINKKNEIMLCFITNTNKLEKDSILVKEITNKFPSVISILHNINVGDSPLHLGDKTNVIYGKKCLTDTIFNTIFEIDINSFYQVNPIQTEKLYSKVFEYLNLNEDNTIIDAYCGIGTMSLLASKKCKKVYGIEVVKEAIINANKNKELNNITNAEFILGKAEDKIEELVKNNSIDALIVDPPRKGCEESFLRSIINIPKIVYVSCNPSTLARDLKFLKDYYEIKEVQPVDMFPNTNHVECVVNMCLKK